MTIRNFKSYLDNGRAMVDARIATLEDSGSLRALREERNTYSCAVHVLPEILTHIFLDVVNDIYERDGESIQQFYLPHVCRYWYEVALRSQDYWRYQPLGGGGRLRPPHIVERAGGRPLHLWGKLSPDEPCWDSPERDYILSQAESVKIYLSQIYLPPSLNSESAGPVIDIPGFLKPFLKGGAPNLKSLTLNADDMAKWVRIPENAFGNFPCLRSFTLQNFEWSLASWRTPIFVSSLTHITLQGSILWDSTCIETLLRLPSLRYLDIGGITGMGGGEVYFESPIDSSSIKLGNLEVLRVHGEVRLLGILALKLGIPLSTSITLISTFLDGPFEDGSPHEPFDLEPLLLWLSRRLQKLDQDSIPVHTMHIKFKPWLRRCYTGTLRLYHSPDSTVDPVQITKAEDARLPLEIQFHRVHRFASGFDAVIPMITSKLQLSTVRVLYLDNIPPFDVETVLSGFTGVQTLRLSGSDSTNMLQDLIPARSRRDMLLPALKTLVLYEAGFDEEFKHLISFVADRSKRCLPVEKVYLSQCKHVREECLRTIRQHVSVVEWDGSGSLKT